MQEKKSWKNYIWTIPLIGVIFIFIGILTPTAYTKVFYIQESFWMWGLNYRSSGMLSIVEFFFYAYEIFIPSLVCFAFMIISFIILIVLVSKEKSKPTSKKNSLIIVGTSIIIITIAYIISMEIGFKLYFQRYYYYPIAPSFWGTYGINFGIIGPIFGGIFTIIGGLISKFHDKIDENIKKKEPKVQISEGKISKSPINNPPHKYCTNCGAELEDAFCGECGTKA